MCCQVVCPGPTQHTYRQGSNTQIAHACMCSDRTVRRAGKKGCFRRRCGCSHDVCMTARSSCCVLQARHLLGLQTAPFPLHCRRRCSQWRCGETKINSRIVLFTVKSALPACAARASQAHSQLCRGTRRLQLGPRLPRTLLHLCWCIDCAPAAIVVSPPSLLSDACAWYGARGAGRTTHCSP